MRNAWVQILRDCPEGPARFRIAPAGSQPREAGKLRLGSSLSLLSAAALRAQGRCAGPGEPHSAAGDAAWVRAGGRAAHGGSLRAEGTRSAGSQAPPCDPVAWLRGRPFSQQFPLSLLHSTLHLPADV